MKLQVPSLKTESVSEMAEFFKVFGDSTDCVFFLLGKGELPVNSISEALQMGQSAISQQLKLLRASDW
jgi:DNA-binding transcriptional ArsR family regulator